MPQHKSAEKRVRQSKRRNERNRANKTAMKKLVKAVKGATKPEDAATALRAAVEKLDRMATKGVIHKNNAANKKSKLARLVNKLSAQPVIPATK